MKNFKFLFIAILGVVSFLPSKAQFGTAYTFPLIAGDTLNNVDTVFKGFTTTGGYRDIGIQVLVNKLSGTVAGKLILMASMDGKTYTPTDSMSYAVPVTSSANTPAATNTAWIWKTGAPFTYYMVMSTSTGTMSAQVKVSYTLRKSIVVISN